MSARIGSYAEMAARNGMAAIMFTGLLGEGSTIVPPYGGAARRFSTNPVSIGFPYMEENPVLLDFATSIGAEGKLRVYRARGHDLPDEWVIDPDGNPSRDPNDFYAGGAILPLGGTQVGHKGYALAFMAAVLGGLVGSTASPTRPGRPIRAARPSSSSISTASCRRTAFANESTGWSDTPRTRR